MAESSTSAAAKLPTPQRQRQKTAEVWDEDFEFPTITIPKGKGKEPESTSATTLRETRTADGYGDEEDVSSVEDWDLEEPEEGSPAGPSRILPSPTTGKRKSPESLGLGQLSLGSPRTSSSRYQDQPIPRSSSVPLHNPYASVTDSSSALQLVSGVSNTHQGQDNSKQRTRSGSVTASRNKLIKRHPSTTFIPLASSSSSDTLSKIPPLPVSRSSYDVSRLDNGQKPIHRSKSGEMMPPPPVPELTSHIRNLSKQRTSSRPGSRQHEVRVSAIPLSPYNEQDRNVEHTKKPGFWKRLSGQPLMGEPKTSPGTYIQDSIRLHRRRSSSLGLNKTPETTDRPPVPPIPLNLNLRSPSANSNISSSSVASSTRSVPMSAIAMIRRSASSLSRKSENTTPPSAYLQRTASRTRSSTSINAPAPEESPYDTLSPLSGPSQEDLRSPASQTTRAFSRGFHLPSPSAGSPYRSPLPSAFSPPPLPHSTSYPVIPPREGSDTDTETEEVDRTPRRKKIRPVSALPAPRMGYGQTRAWNGDGWRGFSDQGPIKSIGEGVEPLPMAPRSISAEMPPALQIRTSSPRTSTFASSTANTLRRIGSMSKKHGRRLSGGFRFGPGPSTAEPRSPTTLEVVAGSPSKPNRLDIEDEDECDDRVPSASAPTSVIRDPTGSRSSQNGRTITGTLKSEKHRRRQSWNDFIIPSSVLAKQKDLKKNLSAVKQFASGLDKLRSLLETRAEMQLHAINSGHKDQYADIEQLEREYSQWWEMAIVLIEVGNTGGPTGSNRTSSDTVERRTSPRTRRITLASDEANLAGDSLRSASDGLPHTESSGILRKGSMSDPSDPSSVGFSPPRATPEQWRASTGRQDLSKRQLEVLRTMLSTPVEDRPGFSESTSPSAPSKPTRTAVTNATMRQLSRSTASDRSTSGITCPSPSNSTYIVPSDSFPSPATASALANPKRQSRAGLAGLKEFLRTLKTRPDLPTSPSDRRVSSFSPPRSPKARARYPQTATVAKFGDISADSPDLPSAPSQPSLISKQHKRPSIRNIFRTSSGNWSDLVKNDKRQESSSSTSSIGLPRLPSRSNLKSTKSPLLGRKISVSRKQQRGDGPRDNVPPLPTPTGENENTVRAVRKSRIIGLGWPEMEDSLPSSSASTPPRPGPVRRSTTSDKDGYGLDTGFGLAGRDTTKTTTTMTTEGTWSGLPPLDDRPEVGELTVALTPENLPVLLDYLRTCERMLGEWKVRVRGLMPGAEEAEKGGYNL